MPNSEPWFHEGPGWDEMNVRSRSQLLSLDDVAADLKVSTRTVRRLISRGELVAHRVGGQLRVDVASIRRFLDASRIGAKGKNTPWQGDVTSLASRTSRGAAASPSIGGRGLTVEKSRSRQPTAMKQTGGIADAAAEHSRTESGTTPAKTAKLTEVALPFAEDCQPPRYTPQTSRSYVERVARFVEWANETNIDSTDQLTTKVLRRFARERGKLGTSNATINRDLSAIRAFMKYLAGEGYAVEKLDAVTYAELRVREPRPKPNGVTLGIAQVDSFLEKADAVSSAGYASLFRVTAGSGIRIDEARHLELSDIDEKQGRLEVNPKAGWTTKGYRARHVPISAATVKAARMFIKHRDKVTLDDKSVWSEIQRVRKLVELPHFSMHDLRRAWASAMHANGASLKQISVWLGHSSVQVTERYIRLLADADSGHAYLPR